MLTLILRSGVSMFCHLPSELIRDLPEFHNKNQNADHQIQWALRALLFSEIMALVSFSVNHKNCICPMDEYVANGGKKEIISNESSKVVYHNNFSE